MDVERLLRPHLRAFKPYTSARDEFTGEAAVFLDANENPHGSTAGAAVAGGLNRYPDPLQRELKARLAEALGVRPENLFLGNGSDEAIDLLVRAFCEPGRDRVLITPPTYGMYRVAAELNAVDVAAVPLTEDFRLDADAAVAALTPATPLVFLCSPNNPTGNALERAAVERVLERAPGLVVVDEAYGDFAPGRSFLPLLERFDNLAVLRTFSKAWGLAALRLGVLVAHPDVAAALARIKPPYNVGAVPQRLALEALTREAAKDAMVEKILAARARLAAALQTTPGVLHVFPSDANFLLVKVADADALYRELLARGVVVRNRSREPGCAGCLRVTVGTEAENDRLLSTLAEVAR
jgi:histidinol-phosphate aminotransferase